MFARDGVISNISLRYCEKPRLVGATWQSYFYRNYKYDVSELFQRLFNTLIDPVKFAVADTIRRQNIQHITQRA